MALLALWLANFHGSLVDMACYFMWFSRARSENKRVGALGGEPHFMPPLFKRPADRRVAVPVVRCPSMPGVELRAIFT